jgi:hypothetical protein
MIPPAPTALTARLTGLGILLLGFDLGHLNAAAPPGPLPSLATALAAKSDLWGEAAMAQPNGASYEFFAPLLPPPRYVNADFRYYPIVLSPPNAIVKARLISNGSGVNLRGGTRSWHDNGTPFTFRVGPDEPEAQGVGEPVRVRRGRFDPIDEDRDDLYEPIAQSPLSRRFILKPL